MTDKKKLTRTGGAPVPELRYIGNCMKADPVYGEGVAKALGIPLSEVQR